MNAEHIAEALGGRPSGAGFMARCPAHEDRNPSLSLKDADGKVLAHCFAGCEQSAVVGALRALELWPEREEPKASRHIVATYDYSDETGASLYEVVRYEPGRNGKKKDFSQRYRDSRGAWVWRKHPNQVLYRLPEVLESPIVFIVEGERDVETLRGWGFPATTNAGGADAPWLPQFTEALWGKEVFLVPDSDTPGRLRGARIARALLGNVAKLTALKLDDGSKDITEWFERGHSEVELMARLDVAYAS